MKNKGPFLPIQEFRKTTGLSQTAFAEYFDIPIRTLQCWETGERKAPKYVINLIETVWEYDHLNEE